MSLTSVPWRTLSQPASFAGTGLFCAHRCYVRVEPASAGHGLMFERADVPKGGVIPVCSSRVIAKPRQTVLASDGVSVQTVEHLLSALVGMGVNCARLVVEGPEIPIMDGSAAHFVEGLRAAGVTAAQGGGAALEPIVVTRRVELTESSARIVAEPWDDGDQAPRLGVRYELDYGGVIPAQAAEFVVQHAMPDTAGYATQIAPARTFCTEAEGRQLQAAGLFTHLRPGDVLVIGPAGAIGTSLRFADEPARHKVLDVIGDLALAGRPIHGRVTATRSGHALNQRLARMLLGE